MTYLRVLLQSKLLAHRQPHDQLKKINSALFEFFCLVFRQFKATVTDHPLG